jgi:hypothetical protein
LILETGAIFSVLKDSKKVKMLNLQKGYSFPIGGFGDEGASKGYQTKVNKVSLNGVNSSVDFSDVTFAYIPLSGTKYYLDQEQLIIKSPIVINCKTIFFAARYHGCLVNYLCLASTKICWQ